jgi:hypothetical protein
LTVSGLAEKVFMIDIPEKAGPKEPGILQNAD